MSRQYLLAFALLALVNLDFQISQSQAQAHPTEEDTIFHIVKVNQKWKNPDLGNVLSLKAGVKIVRQSIEDVDLAFPITNILDERKGDTAIWRAIRSKKKAPSFVVELPNPEKITTFSFNSKFAHEDSLEGVSPRFVRVEFSNTSPDEGFEKVIPGWTLKRRSNEQIVTIKDSKPVKWIKFTFLSNYGHPDCIEIGRIYGYNDSAISDYESELLQNGKLEMSQIQFDHNSHTVKVESYHIIERVAKLMADFPEWVMIIEGHTDNTGSDMANSALSAERAQAVRHLLIEAGISNDRLTSNGFGSSVPLVDNASAENRAMNRRVTFKLKLPAGEGQNEGNH